LFVLVGGGGHFPSSGWGNPSPKNKIFPPPPPPKKTDKLSF